MAQEWTNFSPSPTYTNGNVENVDFNFFSQSYFQDIAESPLGIEVKIYKQRPSNTEHEPICIKGVVQQVTSDGEDASKKRQILCPIGILESGDYVFYKGRYWIIVGLVDDNGFYAKAVMYYCNWLLKFQCPHLCGDIVEYPVYCQNAVQYNNGVTTTAQLQVGSNQNLIYIQGNEETLSVKRDARFLIDKDVVTPTAFKLTRIDNTSYNFKDKGILSWMVVECQTEFINDDILNGVAGYLDKNKDILHQNVNPYISEKNQKLIKEWM